MRRKKIRLTDPARLASLAGALGPVATVLLFLALVVAAWVGVPRLERRLAADPAARIEQVRIEWPGESGATWLPEEFQSALTALARRALERDRDPFSTSALEAAARALLETGWFHRLDAVAREPGGIVVVRGAWRVPAAVVRHGGLDHLVASGGELLPPTYLPGASGQKVILGVSMPPPREGTRPACGRVWAAGTGEIAAALELLAFMGDRPWRDQVAGIDVSEYARRKRLTITTVFGNRIDWGGAPGDAIPGEQPAYYKLRRLDVLAQQFGQIDAGERTVDITGPLTLIDKRPQGVP